MAKDTPDRRSRIVSAALAVFTEKGIGHTKMADIAARAELDQALLRYHFPNLDSLYLEVFRAVVSGEEGFPEGLATVAAMAPLKALQTYVTGYFEWGAKHRGRLSLFQYFYYLASYHPEFTRINDERRAVGRMRIAGMLHLAIEKRALPIPKRRSVDELAHLIQGAILGGLLACFTESGADSALGARRTWEMVGAILNLDT